MRRCALVLSSLLVSGVVPLHAADEAGKFAVRNAGMKTCREFLADKAQQTPAYNLYLGWIDGYVSAANQFTADTFDLLPWSSTPLLGSVLANHCADAPDERFYVAVNKMLGAMQAKRLRQHSELVETSYQGHTTHVYKAVLEDVQRALLVRGFYKGDVDGDFSDGTREALARYQDAKGLKVTSLPDQLTLYHLLAHPETP